MKANSHLHIINLTATFQIDNHHWTIPTINGSIDMFFGTSRHTFTVTSVLERRFLISERFATRFCCMYYKESRFTRLWNKFFHHFCYP